MPTPFDLENAAEAQVAAEAQANAKAQAAAEAEAAAETQAADKVKTTAGLAAAEAIAEQRAELLADLLTKVETYNTEGDRDSLIEQLKVDQDLTIKDGIMTLVGIRVEMSGHRARGRLPERISK